MIIEPYVVCALVLNGKKLEISDSIESILPSFWLTVVHDNVLVLKESAFKWNFEILQLPKVILVPSHWGSKLFPIAKFWNTPDDAEWLPQLGLIFDPKTYRVIVASFDVFRYWDDVRGAFLLFTGFFLIHFESLNFILLLKLYLLCLNMIYQKLTSLWFVHLGINLR